MRLFERTRRAAPPIVLACILLGCGDAVPHGSTSPSRAVAIPSSDAPLSIRYDSADFESNPQLLARLQKSPFGYYRYIDGAFTERVCSKWAGDGANELTVNLHGDAHLEQYAVADDGCGLADFDSASLGPPIVDLLRFSASLWLAAYQRFSDADADAAVTRFLDGYRAKLADPNATGPEPQAAARVRATFDRGPGAWLDRVERFMLPMTDEGRERLAHSESSYVDAILDQNPELPRSFFTIKHAGALKMGIGSAHEAKFLARVEGPTTAPEDDVILETKQVLDHPLGSCVQAGQFGPAVRVIVGQSRLSGSPQRFLGQVDIEGKKFYVHAWRVHYTELGIGDVQSGRELSELAYDVGLQLGRGHPKHMDDAHEKELRDKLRAYATKNDARIHAGARELANETIAAWRAFRDASKSESRSPKAGRGSSVPAR